MANFKSGDQVVFLPGAPYSSSSTYIVLSTLFDENREPVEGRYFIFNPDAYLPANARILEVEGRFLELV